MKTSFETYPGGGKFRCGIEFKLVQSPLDETDCLMVSVGIDPTRWKFKYEHFWYDGPHTTLDLGPIWFYWNFFALLEIRAKLMKLFRVKLP